MRPDQLAPGEHVKDMGGGWVVLSAEFICAMVKFEKKDEPKQKPKTKRRGLS